MYKNYTEKQGVVFSNIYKILFIMRVIAFLFFAAIMQVSASTNAQKLTYVQKNASLEQLFKEIKKQTGYNIVWYEGKLNPEWSVNANFRKTPLKEVMNIALTGMQLDYTISNKTVVIKEKEMSLMDKLNAAFSNIVVHGRVVDETGAGLQGASVKVKNTNKVTITDVDGHFTLNGVPEKSTLVISYLGYETKEVEASEKMENLQLISGAGKLEEVQINAGYYTVTDRERTGSISRITAKDIEKQPISNPLQALQNRVPGIEITQLTGVPGGGFTVRIRGRNSISSGLDPLYIVDGVTYPSSRLNTSNSDNITQGVNPLSMINPNDIESIEVLKDADATAIYGSRGANGVILISTKKGGKDSKVTANILQGFSKVGNKLKLLNTEQYISMRMEAFRNDGLVPSPIDYDVNGIWDKNKYTDWQDLMIGGTAKTTNTSVNISGGNKNSTYLLGGHYYDEGTVFPGEFGFKRGGVNTNLNFGSTEDRLNASFAANYSHSTSNLLAQDPMQFILRAPNAPDPYDQYGQLNWYYNNIPVVVNPMATLFQTQDATTDNLVGNAKISYKILKNLIINASVGYTSIKREELDKLPNIARNPASNPTSANRSSYFGNTSNTFWIAEPQINYNTKIGQGKLSSLLGMSFQQNSSQYRNINAKNFNSDEVMDNISSATLFSIIQSDYTSYKYAAIYGRLNYSINNKYYMNLTARRDASSRFGPGNQFANFGAIGAAWVFSDEEFISTALPFLSFGKLRASYGVTGNDQILDYQYLQLYSSTASYQGTPTLVSNRISNPDYAWEINKKTEAALQIGILKDKINLQIAYYKNRSSNQLLGLVLPPSVGTSSIIANLPAVVQNSGWEFESNIDILTNKKIKWAININLSVPRNKLLSYPDLSNSSNSTRYIIGKPLNISRLYNTAVDPQTGIYSIEDRDGNRIRNDADLYLNKFIGQFFYGGIQNSVKYKHFNLDILISFSKQNGSSLESSLSTASGAFSTGSSSSNRPTSILSRWQNPGDITGVQRFTTTTTSNYTFAVINGNSSIIDASYARIKNVSLSYSLPKGLTSKIKVKDMAINIQGQNLFTLTNYKGFDPENQLLYRLPPLRNFSFGLQLTL